MSIFNWKRYTNSRKLIAIVRVEFRPGMDELLSLLAQWAYREANSRGEYMEKLEGGRALVLSPPSQAVFLEYVRTQYYTYGNTDPFEWDEDVSDEEKDWLYEWARRAALRMWPKFADDIRSAE